MGEGCEVTVIVDVLSFTTTLSVAADMGVEVLPYRWAGGDPASFARKHHAALAVGRSVARPGQISLSPASLRAAKPLPARVVLPSPNGSTIACHLAATSGTVVGSCLRNLTAVAAWICTRYPPGGAGIAVISAGERWTDGSLRPCLEDLIGAGALLACLRERGWVHPSPEAAAAEAVYRGARQHLPEALRTCASGRELAAAGFGGDVDVAAETDASGSVPLLTSGVFTPATSG